MEIEANPPAPERYKKNIIEENFSLLKRVDDFKDEVARKNNELKSKIIEIESLKETFSVSPAKPIFVDF